MLERFGISKFRTPNLRFTDKGPNKSTPSVRKEKVPKQGSKHLRHFSIQKTNRFAASSWTFKSSSSKDNSSNTNWPRFTQLLSKRLLQSFDGLRSLCGKVCAIRQGLKPTIGDHSKAWSTRTCVDMLGKVPRTRVGVVLGKSCKIQNSSASCNNSNEDTPKAPWEIYTNTHTHTHAY